MRRQRKVKIIATLGPSSSGPEMIRKLFEAGADVFRLNFSHGSHDDHRRNLEAIRALEPEGGPPIGVLMDLQGPKLRVGQFAGGEVELAPGARFRLDLDAAPGDAARASLPHPEVFAALSPGTGITLVVSRGAPTVRVPDLAGMTVEEAQNSLEAVGLTLGTLGRRTSSAQPEGTVYLTSPPAGTLASPLTPVDLTLARRP